MNVDVVKQRVHGTPFHPFSIHISNGVKYSVPHPDFIAFGEDVVVVVELPYSVRILDAPSIVALEDMETRMTA